MTIQRMDHVVVDDLEAAISFFVELGMELDGGTTAVEGEWVRRQRRALAATTTRGLQPIPAHRIELGRPVRGDT